MRSFALFLFCVAQAIDLSAQCGMTTGLLVNPVCGNGTISVNTTGGSGPFTIWVETHQFQGNWVNTQTFTNDTDGDLSFYPFGGSLDRKDQARVTVTDDLGCVATHTAQPWQPTWQQGGPILPYTDCSAGTSTFEFHALNMGSPAPATWSFTMDNGPLTPFLQAWTLASPSHYRYNTALSAGTHTFAMPNVNSPTYFYCGVYWPNITVPQAPSPGDCGGNVKVRAALQGPLPSGTLMSDSLRVHGLVPLTEPYSSFGYVYTGMVPGGAMNPSLLTITGTNAIVDWVVLELRSSANSAQTLFSRPALLQRDGDVVDLDGDGYVNFPTAAGSFYVALRHRNHLPAMTSTTRFLSATPLTVDLSSASVPCYGVNARVTVGSVQCLWAGDSNGDGTLKYTGSGNDRDPLLIAVGSTTPNNTVPNVYDRRDTNLDGVIKYTGSANDRDIILTNVGSTTPNNTRTQQLP